MPPLFPALYQINTRVLFRELAGGRGTFDNLDDSFVASLAKCGFDWLWPLGVWQTGQSARQVSLSNPDWLREYRATLPDFTEADVSGSPFAITAYSVNSDFGGPESLNRLRDRLKKRNLKLLLDFVPNHTAPDHPWVREHPEYYIAGTEDDLACDGANYRRVETIHGPRILALGRDPYFPGWPDTLQLNYRCRAFREAMIGELLRIADQCDGVRCDMAMLLLPDVIHRTWGERSRPSDGSAPVDKSFWEEAIPQIRARHPNFVMMAEVYWDLEWELQQQGFDYTYDKRLYDRLHAGNASGVRMHLCADAEFQRRSVRFLENHDEPRVAAEFDPGKHRAAAVVTFLIPGMRFFHEGQFEGRRVRVSMHLGRRPVERRDTLIATFYEKLLACIKLPAVRDGKWALLECRPAWDGNTSHEKVLAFRWDGPSGERLLVVVNYSAYSGQCYLAPPWNDLRGKRWELADRLGDFRYERTGDDLANRGLYLDLPGWGHHIFTVRALA
jgi:Alpha amylase, catalytic domain